MKANRTKYAASVVTMLVLLIVAVGCDLEANALRDAIDQVAAPANSTASSGGFPGAGSTGGQPSNAPQGQLVSASRPTVQPRGVPARNPQTILIASFNIQAFGEKKIGNRTTAERIATIIQLFDVVAIQEVRATDQTVIPQLLKYINAGGARYDYVLGPRLGRTVSKEQYCFIYDSNRLMTSPQASYTLEDKADLLHREPMVARFVTRVPQGYRPFTFSLMDIHTDPDEVKQEMLVLNDAMRGVREYEWATAGEDDVLLMGDLNAEPKQFGPLGQVPGIFWVIRDQPSNTRKTKLYDNIIFDRGLTNEFTGASGVVDYGDALGIGMEEALTISDHMPIWAEFTITEQPSGANPVMANQPGGASVR